jgi:hypothetical protein
VEIKLNSIIINVFCLLLISHTILNIVEQTVITLVKVLTVDDQLQIILGTLA